MTELDNKVFVVFPKSCDIKVYDSQTFNRLAVVKVKGLGDPGDIVACREDHQLFVSEKESIWLVSTTDKKSNKWLTIQRTTSGFEGLNDGCTLSLRSRRLLVTLDRHLRLYKTTNRELLYDVVCPQYMLWLFHSTETQRHTFVVGHMGTSQNKERHAVS